jgi:transcriptional regulator with XRE-family HTH domain
MLFLTYFFADNVCMDFFTRVKNLARKQGITIESVANSADLSLNTYNSYKKAGNLPRADEAVKIAETLDTTVEFLVTGEENVPVDALLPILGKLLEVVDDIRDLDLRGVKSIAPPAIPEGEPANGH